jgi:ABC-type antimicrobial peptide transport system permease subunit
MRKSQLLKKSLLYYWRTNLAVILGVATAVAVLAGALLVGDSVRNSLRDLVLQRLGKTSYAVNSNGIVREELASEVQTDPAFAGNGFLGVCPLIAIEGTVTHESSKRLASGIKVYGVDERFWKFHQRNRTMVPQNGKVFLSPALAGELGSNVGDSLVLQIQKPSAIPLESLHSKKEELGETVRFTLGEILNADDLGEFSIQPQQAGVRAVFVPLKALQYELELPGKVNSILVSEAVDAEPSPAKTEALDRLLRQHLKLEDLGINVRSITQNDKTTISLEHQSKVLAQPLVSVAENVAKDLSLRPSPLFSYLANSIGAGSESTRELRPSIPYSLVTAVGEQDFNALVQSSGSMVQGSDLPPIVLNEWAASDLAVRPGDQINLSYYLWLDGGHIETKTASFKLAGIVPIRGLAADRDLVPDYPGITGSENLADWDPPFPIDLKLIRQKDEDYWHEYRTTPKAFLQLEVGQKLWQTRFGKLTSLRFESGNKNDNAHVSFEEKLRSSINPLLMGVTVVPARAQGLQASRGATDFGEYFLYFSFFLVVSALLLTTLFFKLGVEQRIREIGVMRAIGFDPGGIRKLFLAEGMILALVGSVLGLLGAIAYGQLMMIGLRTWWVEAVGTTALRLHLSPLSLLLGALGGIGAALVCIGLTLRSLGKQSTRSLLAGTIIDSAVLRKSKRGLVTSFRIAIILTLLGLALLISAAFGLIGQAPGFFGGGTLLLAALLFYQSSWLRRRQTSSLRGTGWWPVARLGFRNTTYRPARSILCIALIASAAFIIVAVDSFRHRSTPQVAERKSSTGGYPLLAESLLPLVNDPNSKDGQDTLNLDSDPSVEGVTFTRFRLQPGDDASCLNLYRPTNPKIIAPTNDFIDSNRFVFQSSLASTPDEVANPWLLLRKEFADGAVPVIADANSLTYVLHLKPGEDLIIQPGDQPVRLRVVAALSDSLFQSELLMSESNFTRLFPDQQGYRFFLMDLKDTNDASTVTAKLEERLADFGFDVQSTSERLASFHRVENTYLSTFQMLGGLGLILGTIGLSAVLLRNILERRRELALMRAVGFNSQHFTLMIIAENAVLLLGGVLTGAICALLAITPVLFTRHGNLFNSSLAVLLLAVLVTGIAASVVATWATLRTPLLSALKAE